MKYDHDLDCEGLLCPLPVLKLRKYVRGLPVGAVVRVRASDAMAAVDIPHFCGQSGHEFLGDCPLESAQAYFIRVGQAPF